MKSSKEEQSFYKEMYAMFYIRDYEVGTDCIALMVQWKMSMCSTFMCCIHQFHSLSLPEACHEQQGRENNTCIIALKIFFKSLRACSI